MKVFDAVMKRRSIRRWQERAVEPDKLERVLEAGRLAPTAKNQQEVRVVVVDDPALRAAMVDVCRGQQHVGQAPVILAICATNLDYMMSCGWPGFILDGMIAGTQITLQAVEEGLGTCWIARFWEVEARELLHIPDNYRVVQLLTLGYPGETPDPKPRIPMSDFRRDNSF